MPATIGSVSSGTHRAEDLLESFAWELEYLARKDGRLLEFGGLILEAATADPETDEGSEVVAALFDALGEFAPPYTYFGAHEGDGADFGFWPSMDSVDELERFADFPDELPGDDFAVVNDHGNVTVYGADGSVIWDCV